MIIFEQKGCCYRCIHADLELRVVCYDDCVPVYSLECKHDNVCYDLIMEKESEEDNA